MAVAEILIGAFITVLFEKLASSDLIMFARSEGIDSQLQKWTNTLIQIKALLVDAGQKHITDRSVQLWLHNLQDLAYDIDDLLDDLATEALRRRLTHECQTSTRTVRKLIPTCCANFTPRTIMYGRKMSSKLDQITTRLHDLVEQKNILGLNVNVERSIRTSRRPEETSLIEESSIVGRERDQEVLLNKLLENEPCDQNVSIVPIVGLGGIGKTTLARLLYNKKKVKDHFEIMVWVCVSDEFDIFKISKIILQAVTKENKEFADLNLLQVAIQDKLSKKKFLIVLDDVWNESYKDWELLQRPFLVGARGSKIVVTTRKDTVATIMDFAHAYPLEVLQNDEALSLFAQHALGEKNFDLHPTLKPHGIGIVKKCGGLPLALVILGRLLRTKANDEVWGELLNSEIWNLPNEDEILPALKLSYHDLSPHLKQIFAYCSLFPKDYVFDKDELVLLWMGEGFLPQSNRGMSMESLGFKYFEDLASRSFFQPLGNEKSRYIMHDLLNDLATSVAREFLFRMDEKMNVDKKNEALDKLHHFSFDRQTYGVYKKFKAFQRAKRLRTFLAVSVEQPSDHWTSFHLSNKVLLELVPQLRFLRVLSLSGYSISEIPQAIGSLKHLRYLNFSGTRIRCLPEQVSNLYNLQTLLLCGCRELTNLPNNFAKLVNLRHIDINDTPNLKKMPLGIAGLTSLHTLSKVIIEETNGFKLTDLKGLSDLRGRLSMKGLHKVSNAIHAKEANLMQKKGLDDLEMEWDDVFDDSRNESIEHEVIEGLMPHDKLRNLEIVFYGGTKFPSWVGDMSFVHLTGITIRGCRSCTNLPTLGHLSSLQKLFIGSMDMVTTVSSELLGPADSLQGIAFPSLEILEFRDMPGLETWSTNGHNNDEVVGVFPRLRELTMVSCPKLVRISIRLIPSLRVLHIDRCSVEALRGIVGVASSILRLEMKNIEGMNQLHGGVLEHLGAVEEVSIDNCKELKYIWESEAEASKILVNLRVLKVRDCEELVSLGKNESNLGKESLKSLRELDIAFCPRLEHYSCSKNIDKLVIMKCPITSFPFPIGQTVPSSLKTLEIRYCGEMADPGEESWHLLNDNSSSLESLFIETWPSLRWFPEGCFIHLTRLMIWDCKGIESFPKRGYGFLPLFGLRSLSIKNCKNLKWFPDEQLQSLTSLVEMEIVDCQSMDNSFPRGLWPPNLTSLRLGQLKKPMSEWGTQNFPISLVHLHLEGKNPGMISFSEHAGSSSNPLSFCLPSSLTSLLIFGLEDLESLSKGLQHLTSLNTLGIWSCKKLRDLPEMLLPSLSDLFILRCPRLNRRRDDYWPLVSQIPCYQHGY